MPRPPRSRRAHSERRTARYDSASTGPSAAMSTSSASSASSACACVAGSRRMPRASRSASSIVAGSTCTGSGGSSPRSIPSRPAAISPPSARYGFALASAAFSSTFVDASSAPANTDGTRTGASRLSWPQQVNAPGPVLRDDPAVRVEARRRQPAQRRAGARARPRRTSAPRPRAGRARPASWKRLREPSASHSEKWMWQPLPALSGHGFGASEATRPCRDATPRIVSRTSSCSSAARSAGACAVEISCWPWPSSA